MLSYKSSLFFAQAMIEDTHSPSKLNLPHAPLPPASQKTNQNAILFYTELEKIAHRFVMLGGYLGTLTMICVVALIWLVIPPDQQTTMLWSSFICIIILALITHYKYWPFQVPSYTAAGIGLVTAALSTAVIGWSIQSNYSLLFFIIFANTLIAVMPWPKYPLRVISISLAFTFVIFDAVTVFPDERITIVSPILLLFVITSTAATFSFNNLINQQWWQQFSAKQEIKRLNDHLSQRAAELGQANESLKKHNAELNAFARSLAHDLKNPVGAIIGYAEMLDEGLDDEMPDLPERILRSSERAMAMVRELLLLSSILKKGVDTHPLFMDIIVDTVLQRLDPLITEVNPEITLPAEWPTVIGYTTWVEEIWVNYFNNALRHHTTPPCIIECGAEPTADGQIRFWLKDNGPGISPEQQAKLFRSDKLVPKVQGKGEGLGLASVKLIVEKLGGQTGVDSELGQGSCFWFTLPTAEARF